MADMNRQRLPSASADRTHEGNDINLAAILIPAGLLAGVIVLLSFMAWGLLSLFAGHPERPEASLSPLARLPQKAPSPPPDLAEFRAKEDAELNGYGWADRPAGRVRIPIERAKDLFLQENGVISRKPPSTMQSSPSNSGGGVGR